MAQQHFVLVHGACHGAWSWYKLKTLLKSAGHRVTALDLAASGINKKSINEVHTFNDYSEPLLETMASLVPDEKVILVGHSLGGLSLALAMEKFPDKVSVAVFVTAFMPDTTHHPSYVLDQYCKKTPEESWLDTQFSSSGNSNEPQALVGSKFMACKAYQLSPIEDLELATVLTRPGSFFLQDLTKANNFLNHRYGSVTRVYVVYKEDNCILEEFQRWMIENSGAKEVMEIKGADHMAMFSKPRELCNLLLEIADKYT